MKPRWNHVTILAVAGLIVLPLISSACAVQSTSAPATTQVQPTAPAKPTSVPVATEKPATSTAVPNAAGPKIGGTLVYAVPSMAYDGLDPQSAGARSTQGLPTYMASSLVTRDINTGEIVPWLAESWNVSADGLTYTFKLKKNVKWQDGTPFTAKDYVYTIHRHKDPATKSPTAERTWGPVVSAEAPDDYTLVLKLSAPDITFLSNLAISPLFNQPVPQHAIEKMGNKFATQPVLSGPFKFKESQPGVKIVLERNPDYNWGPASQPGPAYIQNLEFREVKDYATILAGLEAGEIDLAKIQPQDIERLTASGKVKIMSVPVLGLDTNVVMNVSKAPWDDVRVRKAINLALDRQAIIKVAAFGQAEEQKGPVAKGAFGYWSGVEQIGYGFDLNQAKALMNEAGYTQGSDGILEKDGKPLRFTLKAEAQNPYDKVALLVKEQLGALGIDLEIQMTPESELRAELVPGNYDLAIAGVSGQPNGLLLLNEVFNSSQINALNYNRVSDPSLDKLITGALQATDAKKSLDLAAEAQKLIVEKAYCVPIYTSRWFYAVSNRVKGVVLNNNILLYPDLTSAYIENGK